MKTWLLLWLALGSVVQADDLARLYADRTAIERVYYQHRLGDKPPFEQILPPTHVEQLVRADLRKETVLKEVYGVEITPAQIAAEVQRIDATTRAPEVLAELKTALDNDPARFARTVARPIVVERLLRDRFDNDDALHAGQRRQAEAARASLLAIPAEPAGPGGRLTGLRQLGSNQVSETTWQMTPRPPEAGAPDVHEPGGDPKFYFDELPGPLQLVLRAQLHRAGNVSAVIETPAGFLVYLCEETTAASMRVAILSIPKRNYEQWLAEQKE
jgi:hypothetical protein